MKVIFSIIILAIPKTTSPTALKTNIIVAYVYQPLRLT